MEHEYQQQTEATDAPIEQSNAPIHLVNPVVPEMPAAARVATAVSSHAPEGETKRRGRKPGSANAKLPDGPVATLGRCARTLRAILECPLGADADFGILQIALTAELEIRVMKYQLEVSEQIFEAALVASRKLAKLKEKRDRAREEIRQLEVPDIDTLVAQMGEAAAQTQVALIEPA